MRFALPVISPPPLGSSAAALFPVPFFPDLFVVHLLTQSDFSFGSPFLKRSFFFDPLDIQVLSSNRDVCFA
jgi:hypothetical protein